MEILGSHCLLTLKRYLDKCLNMKIQMVFEALADQNRRKILDLLKASDRSVGELGEHFDISGASLSHHLTKLKAADLVIAKRKGQSIIYSIHTSVFEDVTKELADIFKLGES